MTQKDLIKKTAFTSGKTIADCELIIKTYNELIFTSLQAGEEISVPNVGKLVVKARASRQGMNPRTKEKMTIPPRKAVVFRQAKAIKDALKS